MMAINEIISSFSLEAISKSAAIYDTKKLTWLNAQYLCSFEPERVAWEVVPFLQARGFVKGNPDEKTFAYIKKVSEVVRSRVHTLVELADASSYFYIDDFDYDEKGVKKFFNREGVAELLDQGKEAVKMIPYFDLPNVELAYRNLIDNLGISGGSLIHPTRLALSGKTMGPGLFDIMVTLGKEKCVERLEKAVCWLKKR
ncbi:MAG: Glutamate--tRNA ligase [Desulfotomaculum sp. 46_296]|nr:MAG: Glutamate--tRNA ligase [Desulfotomaculum sp. 46_296]